MRSRRRTLAATCVAVACLAGIALAAEQDRDYRKELRDAQAQQQRKRHKECVAACDKMLDYYKESWQLKEITWLKIENLILDAQLEGALKALAALAKADPDDRKLQTDAALRVGDVQQLLKQLDEAVATYRKAAERCAKDMPDQAADALLRAASILCTDLKKPEEGIALYQEVETKFGAQQPKRAAEALRAMAAAHETHTKDLLKAAVAYRTIADKYAAAYDEGTLAGFYRKAMDCFLGAEKPDEAIEVAKKAEAGLETDAQKVGFAARHGEVLLAAKKCAEAREQFERLIASYPLEQGSCQQAQRRIVEAYHAESKWDDALGAARILYDAAGDEQSIRSAAQVVAQAFLAADATLVRANEFLDFQRFGPEGQDGKPNTEDDVKANHLAKVSYPAFSAGANQRFQAAVGAQPNTYDGYRTKAFLYIYWGKPKEGAAQFRLAFKAADLAKVPAAAQELVLIGMKAHTASFRGLDRIFEYINYGPKGKSGKENIPDPFAGL